MVGLLRYWNRGASFPKVIVLVVYDLRTPLCLMNFGSHVKTVRPETCFLPRTRLSEVEKPLPAPKRNISGYYVKPHIAISTLFVHIYGTLWTEISRSVPDLLPQTEIWGPGAVETFALPMAKTRFDTANPALVKLFLSARFLNWFIRS